MRCGTEVHLVLAGVVISDCPRPLSLQDGNVLLFLESESTGEKLVSWAGPLGHHRILGGRNDETWAPFHPFHPFRAWPKLGYGAATSLASLFTKTKQAMVSRVSDFCYSLCPYAHIHLLNPTQHQDLLFSLAITIGASTTAVVVVLHS